MMKSDVRMWSQLLLLPAVLLLNSIPAQSQTSLYSTDLTDRRPQLFPMADSGARLSA